MQQQMRFLCYSRGTAAAAAAAAVATVRAKPQRMQHPWMQLVTVLWQEAGGGGGGRGVGGGVRSCATLCTQQQQQRAAAAAAVARRSCSGRTTRQIITTISYSHTKKSKQQRIHASLVSHNGVVVLGIRSSSNKSAEIWNNARRQHTRPFSSQGGSNSSASDGPPWNAASSGSSSSSNPKESGHAPQPLILPSVIGLAEWREKVDLDRAENNSSNSNNSNNVLQLPVSQLYRPDLHLPSAPTWTTTTTTTTNHNNNSSSGSSSHLYEASTPVSDELVALIGVTGRPVSTADFMRTALLHPVHGYYTNAVSIRRSRSCRNDSAFDDDDFDFDDDFDKDSSNKTNGSSGNNSASPPQQTIIGADFVTAPEVSNVFGECLGLWFAALWTTTTTTTTATSTNANANANATNNTTANATTVTAATIKKNSNTNNNNSWQWLECGPGKGSLMVDLLRFTLQLSSPSPPSSNNNNKTNHKQFLFGDGCRRVHFIEQSPVFRQQQCDALSAAFVNNGNDTKNKNNNVCFEFHGCTATTNTIVDDGNATSSLPTDKSFSSGENRVISVHWHDSLTAFQLWQQKRIHLKNQDELLPTFVVGQEFLDALPVYAFQKTREGYWRERLVDVALRDDLDDDDDLADKEHYDAKALMSTTTATTPSVETPSLKALDLANQKKPRLRIVLAPEATPPLKTLLQTDDEGYLPNDDATIPAGSVVEVCPEGILFVQDVAAMLEQQGGAALFIDYGSAEGSRDSLRGFTRHEQVHFLSRPGQVDITADVDFMALRHAVNHRRSAAKQQEVQTCTNDSDNTKYGAMTTATSGRKARAFGPITQGEFLVAMGIRERVVSLMEREDCSDEQAEDLYNALVRLASPEEMGQLYKVLAITTTTTPPTEAEDGWEPPPGF